MKTLLSVENLTVRFRQKKSIIHAVNQVSFEVDPGEIIGLVGESGCGKSVTARSILNLIEPPGYIKDGTILFKKRDVLSMPVDELRTIRGNKISMIFQNPGAALNPLFTIGSQITDVLRLHNKQFSKQDARKRAIELLNMVNFPDPENRLDDYPHQLSGGMAQRALIAMAISSEPDLLIADEPTTALDVTIQKQILELLKQLNQSLNLAIIMISHDLSIIKSMCRTVYVMKDGRIVEYGPIKHIFESPEKPYTKLLLDSAGL